MISVYSHGSSSKGNCYVLEKSGSRLMVECGLQWDVILKSIKFNTVGVDGILCSHEHMDHAKGLNSAILSGVDVYTSKGTADALGLCGHRLHYIKSKESFSVGPWIVLPFDTVHDAEEPLCFLITNGNDRLLFLTDTSFCKYQFPGITQLMIECNYSDDLLDQNVKSGSVGSSRRKRLIESHMSLKRVKDFLFAADTSNLQEIHLIHLSNDNSDEIIFKREIQELTGVPVYVCEE